MDGMGNPNAYFLNVIYLFRITSMREENYYVAVFLIERKQKTNKSWKENQRNNNWTMKFYQVRTYYTLPI